MPFLVKADLETHLYSEVIEEITRADDTIIDKCISSGIAEAKGYLSRFDLGQLFGTGGGDPAVDDENLKNKVKDIVAWHLVKLANPTVNLELFRTAYEDAIKWLEKIMMGKTDPAGWPYKPDDPATGFDESSGVQWSSNPKRTQHF